MKKRTVGEEKENRGETHVRVHPVLAHAGFVDHAVAEPDAEDAREERRVIWLRRMLHRDLAARGAHKDLPVPGLPWNRRAPSGNEHPRPF